VLGVLNLQEAPELVAKPNEGFALLAAISERKNIYLSVYPSIYLSIYI
jgi:hypothetical protein